MNSSMVSRSAGNSRIATSIRSGLVSTRENSSSTVPRTTHLHVSASRRARASASESDVGDAPGRGSMRCSPPVIETPPAPGATFCDAGRGEACAGEAAAGLFMDDGGRGDGVAGGVLSGTRTRIGGDSGDT